MTLSTFAVFTLEDYLFCLACGFLPRERAICKQSFLTLITFFSYMEAHSGEMQSFTSIRADLAWAQFFCKGRQHSAVNILLLNFSYLLYCETGNNSLCAHISRVKFNYSFQQLHSYTNGNTTLLIKDKTAHERSRRSRSLMVFSEQLLQTGADLPVFLHWPVLLLPKCKLITDLIKVLNLCVNYH